MNMKNGCTYVYVLYDDGEKTVLGLPTPYDRNKVLLVGVAAARLAPGCPRATKVLRHADK